MSAYNSKYTIGLDGKGYIVSQRSGVRQYQKRRAPTFVSKFGGGDSAYRDATFWQYWVQTNWRNGAKQLKWDDAGKFWKSSDVDTTILEELSLSKQFTSAGQVIPGGKINALEPWRSASNWWDTNYLYRQQITVTAPSATVPVGYPVKITIDTAALQTASKVRSDRNDWRVLYFNGSTWVELSRDYIDTTTTFFATQTALLSGVSDSNYYVYYGNSSEATSKQPTTEAEWNAVYGMYGTTPDANSVLVAHFREGSGTSVNDDSSSSNNGTYTNPDWGTDGKFGRYGKFNASTNNRRVDFGSNSSLNLGSMTLETWIYLTADQPANEGEFFAKKSSGGTAFKFNVDQGTRKLRFTTNVDLISSTALALNTWYHVAATNDGSTGKIFIDGVQDVSGSMSPAVDSSGESLKLGAHAIDSNSGFRGQLQHARVSNSARSSFPYALSSEPSLSFGTEVMTQPPSTSFDLYAGGSDGKVYKWDGNVTWTEQFDTRKLVYYDDISTKDADKIIGDTGGVETAQAQGFQVAAAQTVQSVRLYLKKNAGTPGNITVRVETNNAGVPSGTLVSANATATIPAFTSTSYGFITVNFTTAFTLNATTTYHIVLKTAAGANDNNYAWGADGSSPSFASGAMSVSTDGGATWSAVSAADALFSLLAQTTEINCMKVTSVGGTQKLYVGTGNHTGQTNGDARLYSFDGTTWALNHTFSTSIESMILSIEEYTANAKVYLGIGPQAKVYESSDMSTYTLSKDINIPQNPGYPHTMKEYNRILHVGGGSPELLPTQFYNGFLDVFDTSSWNQLYPFDFTVIKSLEFYDAYLFMGTYRGDLYVYDTASLNPLFNFRDQYNYFVEIRAMKYYNDKLYIGLYPQEGSNETNVGIWLFDRRGLSLAHTIAGVAGYRCFTTVGGLLMVGTGDDGYVYKIDLNNYAATGFCQSSYFDANLPSIEKLYNQLTVRHDPLETGQSISMYYKFKESDSFTLLGTSDTVGAIEKIMPFPTGTHSKKISIKEVLTTTDITLSPKLTERIVQYSLYPERKWQWTLRLKAKKDLRLLDNSFEPRTAIQIREDLENLLNSEQLYLFTDINGVTYTVLTNDVDNSSWVINQLNDGVAEDEVIVNLLEA